MAVPREVIRLPKLRGLNDYPDKAPLGSASEAYNVEFNLGGVSPRKGFEKLLSVAGPSNHEVFIQGVWPWTDHENNDYLVIAYTDAVTDYGYIDLRVPAGGVLIATFSLSEDFNEQTNRVISSQSQNNELFSLFRDPLDTYEPLKHNNNVNADYGFGYKGWGGTPFFPAGQDAAVSGAPTSVFLVSTPTPRYAKATFADADDWDRRDGAQERSGPRAGAKSKEMVPCLWAIIGPSNAELGHAYTCCAVNAINRAPATDFRGRQHVYWGGYAKAGVKYDDPGPYISGDETFPIDGAVDDDITWGTCVAAPSSIIGGNSITSYRNRIVLGSLNDARDKNGIRFSNLGDLQVGRGHEWSDLGPLPPDDPEFPVDWNFPTTAYDPWSVGSGWPIRNVLYFTNPDPSPVIGVTTFRDFLVVFKQQSIHLCRFNNIEDFVDVQAFSDIGSMQANQWMVTNLRGGDTLFFATTRGFFAFDGEIRYLSGPIERRVQEAIGTKVNREKVLIAHRPANHQIWFQVSGSTGKLLDNAGSETQGNVATTKGDSTIFVYDYDNDAWSIFDYGAEFGGFVTSRYAGSKSAELLYGVVRKTAADNGGYTLGSFDLETLCQDTVSSTSTPVIYRYVTQRIAYNHHQVRRWSHVRLAQKEERLLGPAETGNIKVFWLLDNQDRTAADTAVESVDQVYATPISTQEGSVFGTGTFGNARFGTPGYFQTRIAISGGPARWFRVGIESDDTPHNKPWMVNGMEIDTRRKEGRR